MKSLVLILILFGLTTPKSHAYQPEAYPGSFWNSMRSFFNGIDGQGDMGMLTQGVQWVTLPGDVTFQSYVSYRWRLRSLNQTYFDTHGPAVGFEFRKSFLSGGVQYEWQKYPGIPSELNYPSLYLVWYKSVDLISGARPNFFGIPVLALPTSTWGRINEDFLAYEGTSTLGYVGQGVDWFKIPGDITFRTQLQYYWRFRTQNRDYYNSHGPLLGIELERGPFNAGAAYAVERFTSLGQNTQGFRLYFNWFLDWDLKNLARKAE